MFASVSEHSVDIKVPAVFDKTRYCMAFDL